MRRAFRILRWTIEAIVVVVLAVLAGLYAYTGTESFRRLARDQVVALLATTFEGEVSFARLGGSPWGDLTLEDVSVRSGDQPIVEIPRVRAVYSLIPLALGELRFASLEIERPVLRVAETESGSWNLLDALASRTPAPPDAQSSSLAVSIQHLDVRDAAVTVTTRADTPRTVTLSRAEIEGSIDVLPQGIAAAIRSSKVHVETSDAPPLDLDATLHYRATGGPATLSVERLHVVTPASEAALQARLANVDAPKNLAIREATLSIVRISAADVRRVAPQWKPDDPVTGELKAHGTLADLHADAALAAAGASLHATVAGDVLAEKPRVALSAEVTNLDVAKAAGPELGAGVVTASVRANVAGKALADASGEANVAVRDLRAAQWQLGGLVVTAKLAAGRADVNGQLDNPGGKATLRARADLRGAETYDADLVVAHLNPRKAAPGAAPLRGDVNLRASLAGSGFAVEKARAHARIALARSKVGPVDVRSGRLDASLADQRLRIAELALDARDATVRASAELPLDRKKPLEARYEAKARDLSPWLVLVGKTGRGSVSLTGTAKGTTDRPAVRGTLNLADVELEGKKLGRGKLDFDLANAAWPPRGGLHADVGDVNAGVALASANADVRLLGTTPERASVTLAVRDSENRSHTLAADATYAPPRAEVHLTDLSLQTPDGLWKLARPADLVQLGTNLTIRGFEFSGKSGTVTADGSAGASGAQNLHLSIARFPIETVKSFVADLPDFHGMLGLRAELTGSAAAPHLSVTTEVRELRVANQSYAGIDGKLAYDSTRASVDVRFDQDAEHRLTATGSLPIAARWEPAFEARPTGDLDLAVRSSGLSLAFVNAFTQPNAQKVDGALTVDVSVRGPVEAPRPSGSLGLVGGRASLPKLGIDLTDASLDVGFDPEAVRLRSLALRTQSGKIDGTGSIALRNGAPGAARAALSIEHWPAIATPRYAATLDGAITLDGAATAPIVGGRIEVSDVVLKPDIAFLTKQPTERDPTIIVVSGPPPPGTPPPAAARPPAPKPDFYQASTIDVTTVIRRNSWIKHPSATVEIEGEVRAEKPPARDLALVGEIHTVRGWGELQGKRFTVSEGKIAFTGGATIDPSLTIDATYKKGDYTIDALIGGRATAPSLKLVSDPSLSQADILAVLLFGKPTSELSDGQKSDLRQQATEIAESYAVTAVGNQVAKELGLEAAGVQIEELSSEKVTLGKYVTEKTYVTASQGLLGEEGEEVGVEYQFRPHWGIRTSTSSTGSSGVDLTWKKRY